MIRWSVERPRREILKPPRPRSITPPGAPSGRNRRLLDGLVNLDPRLGAGVRLGRVTSSGAQNATRRQHVVSAVLLRRWAVDGYVVARNLEDRRTRLRSPRSEGFVTDLVRGERRGRAALGKDREPGSRRVRCSG